MDMETVRFDGSRWSSDPPRGLDSPRTLVMAFGASSLRDRPALFRALEGAFPTSRVIGCSTAGEMHQGALEDGSLTVAVVRFDEARLASASAPVPSIGESRRAGERIGAELAADDLRAVFVLSDGLTVNGSELVAGITARVPPEAVVTGGLAGDGQAFASTWVLDRGVLRSSMVAAVGIYGERVVVGHGTGGGWEKFGPEREITRSAGNVLFELDGRPALALYKEYLGRRAAELPASGLLFPLLVRRGGGCDAGLVRSIIGVDEEAQSLIFAGDVGEGAVAQLMRANLDGLVDGSERAAMRAMAHHPPGRPVLAVGVSCVGRRMMLGELCEDEVEAFLAVLPGGSRQVGFYAYGEIAPNASGPSELHNQSMSITTLAEV